MQLNKRLEAEVLNVYNSYWENYLAGNVELMSALLADEYSQIGSAASEVFFSKKEAVEFLYKTIDQVAHKSKMLNRRMRLELLDKLILVHDLFDVYVLSDNQWIFYAELRANTLMEEKNNGWKFIHQHSSFPDAKTDEGENLAIDKIAEENRQLREAVKRRTIELEQKNRELEVEAALERVRSRAMAMQSSDELGALIGTVFTELTKLDLVLTRCIIWVFEPKTNAARWWMANVEEPSNPMNFLIKYHEHPAYLTFVNEWKNQNVKFVYDLKGEDKINWDKILFYETELKNLPDVVKNGMQAPERVLLSGSFNNFGGINVASLDALSEEHFDILIRFARIFDQTYTRFLDLQKAEAQAREAHIQLALERVRARTMAMQKSDELPSIAKAMYDQLKSLGLELEDGIIIVVFKENSHDQLQWPVFDGGVASNKMFVVPYFNHPVMNEVYKARESGEKFIERHFDKVTKDSFLEKIFSISDHRDAPDEFKNRCYAGSCYHYTFAMERFTGILMHTFYKETYPEEHNEIVRRFTRVFEQAYVRFLDLQKAEAQAREAQIEAALEKVRSRSLAMHKSDELQEVANNLFERLNELNVNVESANIVLFEEGKRDLNFWVASNYQKGMESFHIPYSDLLITKDVVAARESGTLFFGKSYSFEEKNEWFDYAFKNTAFKFLSEERKQMILGAKAVTISIAFSKHTGIQVTRYSNESLSEEDVEILKKFAKVFEQAYIRFLDLQKAEAQTREATIEAALEKVRGKAMAMHNSNDLSATTSMIITELRKLGITPIRCGVGIVDKEKQKAQLYTARSTSEGDTLAVVGWAVLKEHPILETIYKKWVAGEDYFPELEGDSLRAYYEQLLAGLSVPLPNFTEGGKHYGHFLSVSVGCLYAWSLVRYNDEEIKILKRFASIIDLTFRRYFELQQSEENAKEAMKQAALDRIRADIASMRTINDLDRITPLIWKELTILGIPFIRCGVFIMDETQQLIHTFLSTPDGKAIAAFHLPYDTPGNVRHVLSNWKEKNKYIDHWDESEFRQFAEILVAQGAFDITENYLKTIPSGGFHLHFLPFLQGMLYVGNTEELNKEQIDLIQHVADAFSTAYARYEDFNKLEEAKQQVEKTLTNLKQAQQQLIQSEKMASLGELTAGIAHEIQNPLNFVNNFSELNAELIDELQTGIDAGNFEEIKTLARDIKENEEKINYHGKRADAIVKGMLQHSRNSSAVKEPTDINQLVDEYARLAYHGLRAKDNFFNATVKTDYDDSIGCVNIIPQDIGRVILNLITNAFYAVSRKKKEIGDGYEPTVEVSSKKEGSNVEIKVTDNGNGIPEKYLDKIFQPFFTTKPTGQGTGLGLSLSYDIVKAHGGELKVETTQGIYTAFTIQLSAE